MTEQILTLTYEQALASLEQAIAERGEDFVYPQEWRTSVSENFKGWCVNFNQDGSPSCIAGYVYSLWSIENDEVWREDSVDTLAGRDGGEKDAATAPLQIDARTYVLLSSAQNAQDSGSTWKQALEIALRDVEAYDLNQIAND